MNKPAINVTPLIDVLLVLLIIFMVVAPLKPSGFKARVPAELKNIVPAKDDPKTLAVVIEPDASLRLNDEAGLGTTDDPSLLIERLGFVFEQRLANGDISELFADDPNRPLNDRIERMVFIKAPRTANYGSVVMVIDAVKLAGGYPISLQIDGLD